MSMPGYKLICPECNCDNLEQYFTPKQRNDKFKCSGCGKITTLPRMMYVSCFSEDDTVKMVFGGGEVANEDEANDSESELNGEKQLNDEEIETLIETERQGAVN